MLVRRCTASQSVSQSVEEDEVGLSRGRADVQIDEPVDGVECAEQQREGDARVAVDGAGEHHVRRRRRTRTDKLVPVDAGGRRAGLQRA